MIVLSSINDPRLPRLLSEGKVGVMPTDTIYGLVAMATNPQAVERLYALKQRRDNVRSGTVIAANTQQLANLGVDAKVLSKVRYLWPNPLSIELPLPQNMAYLFQSGAHRAFRVVAEPAIASLLGTVGPLLTSSANLSGESPANTVIEAHEYFGNKVDFYVEGGDMSGRPASTVARFRDDGKLEVLRQGAIVLDDLQIAQTKEGEAPAPAKRP